MSSCKRAMRVLKCNKIIFPSEIKIEHYYVSQTMPANNVKVEILFTVSGKPRMKILLNNFFFKLISHNKRKCFAFHKRTRCERGCNTYVDDAVFRDG